MVLKQLVLGLIVVVGLVFIISCTDPDVPVLNPYNNNGTDDEGASADDTPMRIESPKLAFKELVKKASESDDYKIVYRTKASLLHEQTPGLKMDVGYLKKGDKNRMTVEATAKSTAYVSIHEINDGLILCSKGDPSHEVSGEEYQCMTESGSEGYAIIMMTFFGSKYIDNFNHYTDYTIKYLGEKVIIGRKCHEFELELADFAGLMIAGFEGPDKPDLDNLGPNEQIPRESRMTLCLDEKTGHELAIEVLFIDNSGLIENKKEYASSEAIVFEEGIDDSEFLVPGGFVISRIAYDEDEVFVMMKPFQSYDGMVEIKMYNASLSRSGEIDEYIPDSKMTIGPVQLNAMEEQVFVLEHHLTLPEYESYYDYKNSYYIEICYDDNCQGEYIYESGNSTIDCLRYSTDMTACSEMRDCEYRDPICNVMTFPPPPTPPTRREQFEAVEVEKVDVEGAFEEDIETVEDVIVEEDTVIY